MNTLDPVKRGTLPIILLCAVVQGWSLYGLHLSIANHVWPATQPAWLLALYSIMVFVPVTIELLAASESRLLGWCLITTIAAIIFYIGWFYGAHLSGPTFDRLEQYGLAFPMAFELLLWWLVLLPFVQSRLVKGSWSADYGQLFASAWRNKLTLAEACLFTALFWALLALWQMLFHLLAIDYFRELFQEPAFIYPITALTFGVGLHLIGSLDQWTRVVLEQILSVLKWLALLASVILVLFSLALVPKLPTLVFTGSRAIDASWLLWLVAVVVLFLNAAFRDGSIAEPYPRKVGQLVRYCAPLLILIAVTAAYALFARIREYGLTVERFWALIVATFSLIYAFGYSGAAMQRGPWMQRVAHVNVVAALLMLVVLTASLTPIANPYRLAAASQYRMALHWVRDGGTSVGSGRLQSPFQYLRFDAGSYGLSRLRQLAGDATVSESIRTLASKALVLKTRWEPMEVRDADSILAKLVTYPAGSSLTPDLKGELKADFFDKPQAHLGMYSGMSPVGGLFVDLDGDGQDEFVLLWTTGARVYKQDSNRWVAIGDMFGGGDNEKTLTDRLAEADVHVRSRKWQDLKVGQRWYRFSGESKE